MSQEQFLVSSNTKGVQDFINHFMKSTYLSKLYKSEHMNEGKFYHYTAVDFWVYDSENIKIVCNLTSTGDSNYNYGFDKRTGLTIRYGKTVNDDPDYCPLGPEILDLEISVNGCPKVGGHNCKFCYKNNTDKAPTNMDLTTFRTIVDSFPKNLSQIAFGITGTQTNPDFPLMLAYCRQLGIIPNYTLSGADLTDDIIESTKDCCGAVAVSCYEGNKDLCYNTIDRFHKLAPNVHVNMHIVLSEDTLPHVMDVLKDLSHDRTVTKEVKCGNKVAFTVVKKVPQDPRLEFLRHIVFLRIKPVGRATKLNTKISLDTFEKVIDYCTEHGIGYGFDSCSAPDVEQVLKNKGKPELVTCIEACESGRLSSYINVKGEYWHCSFAERDSRIFPIKVTDYKVATSWWNSDQMNDFRKRMNLRNGMRCPLFDLTAQNEQH